MDQTPDFDCHNLQILVLDEADRILDSGFEKTLNAILENLPPRQTLLFSATQTKAVKDLARLSVKDAEYISVHEAAKAATPKNLVQHYIACELSQKLDILYSFIRTHLKQKTLVFLSSGKQVRFVFEAFCKMQPGVPLMCLHGKQSQQKRMAIFDQFSKKSQAVLFATDIAARGLDIPAVDWVFQVDCPDDAATYIHRVGRTARNEANGQALMLLLPSEREGMLKELESKKVPIEEIKVNPSKTQSIKNQLASLCSESPDMKYLAQKAFITYLRSIYLQSNKAIFDVHAMPHDAFAEALGLPGAPNIKFKQQGNKNKSRQIEALDNKSIKVPKPVSGKKKALSIAHASSDDDDNADEAAQPKKPKTKIDKLFAQKNLTVLSSHYAKLKEDGQDSDDDLLTLARANHEVSDNEEIVLAKKKGTKLQKAKEEFGLGKKLVFDDDGDAYDPFTLEKLQDFSKQDVRQKRVDYIEASASRMKEIDVVDKSVEKERRRELKRARKLKEKAVRREQSGYLPQEDEADDSDRGSHEYQSGESNAGSDADEEAAPAKRQRLDMSQQTLEELALQLLK
ncbi:ATP-dependent RNA helicase dbp4 [Kappamyces sp. JEL0680]|nr:ATP-dependent RNA helicase dbp4 [Kappamyces sp. JEL0680]